MIPRIHTQFIALVFIFALCQVIGAMCALPDLSAAKDTAILVEESMACPMDGTLMCPPSATSSPERHAKNGPDADQTSALPSVITALMSLSVEPQWSWNSEFSLVSFSISSSSVLRI